MEMLTEIGVLAVVVATVAGFFWRGRQRRVSMVARLTPLRSEIARAQDMTVDEKLALLDRLEVARSEMAITFRWAPRLPMFGSEVRFGFDDLEGHHQRLGPRAAMIITAWAFLLELSEFERFVCHVRKRTPPAWLEAVDQKLKQRS